MPADLKAFIDVIQGIGFVGLLILLAFPATRQKLGFDTKPADNSEIVAAAIKKALVDDDNSPILVKARIKRICDSIEKIERIQASNTERQADMAETLSFIKGKLDA